MKNYLYLTFSKKKLSPIFQTLPDEAAMNLAVTYSKITDQLYWKRSTASSAILPTSAKMKLA